MGFCYRCSRFLSFCTGQLQKGLLDHTRKVWILTKAMASSSDYGYSVWQKRHHGQCKNRGRPKFDIPSGIFDKSRGYSFDNYTYYYTYGRLDKRTQTKKRQYFSIYSWYS